MATKFTRYDDGEPEPAKNGSNGNGNGHANGKPLNGEIVLRNGEIVPAEADIRVRDAQILDLRSQGWPIQALADEFSLSKSTIDKAIKRALAYIPSQNTEEVRRMSDIVLDRNLRVLTKALMAENWVVSQGKAVIDPVTNERMRDWQPNIIAAREIRELTESRRKMHGADAAAKSVHASLPLSAHADRIAELMARTGTEGVLDPAVRELLGIPEPLEGVLDDGG